MNSRPRLSGSRLGVEGLTQEFGVSATLGSGLCVTIIYLPALLLCSLGGRLSPEQPPPQPPIWEGQAPRCGHAWSICVLSN